MILPGTGIVLNNEMDDFSLAPGVRAFGLLGSKANQIMPGSVRFSMTPTIIHDREVTLNEHWCFGGLELSQPFFKRSCDTWT